MINRLYAVSGFMTKIKTKTTTNIRTAANNKNSKRKTTAYISATCWMVYILSTGQELSRCTFLCWTHCISSLAHAWFKWIVCSLCGFVFHSRTVLATIQTQSQYTEFRFSFDNMQIHTENIPEFWMQWKNVYRTL